jgi:hypothetical protein
MATMETLEKELSDLGVMREEAAARRLKVFADLRQLSVLAEAGDRKAVAEQGPLNKSAEDESRLIVRIDREMKDVKRRLDLARVQSACAASCAARLLPSAEHTRWFSIQTPTGQIVKHKHASAAALRASLLPGYTVRSEIFGCDENGEGGFEVMAGQRAQLLKALSEMSA